MQVEEEVKVIILDNGFITDNLMGPNAIKIIEELTMGLNIKKGARVLDLGCGRGLTSIYLAMKYDVMVYAADLWIDPTDNLSRVMELDLENKIVPIRVDANSIPFADGYFDLIVSIDAYHYFGAEEGFLDDRISKLLKPKGEIFVAVPGIKNPYENDIPKVMKAFGVEESHFHSCDWWKRLWSKSCLLEDIRCEEMSCFKAAWDDWLMTDNIHAIEDREMMNADGGKYLNLISLKGKRF